MTLNSCRPERSRRSRRRETDAKSPRLRKNATSFHSPTTAKPQKTTVAEFIIKHANQISTQNSLNYDVEGWRFMGAWKN
jgi:hypothetical protein